MYYTISKYVIYDVWNKSVASFVELMGASNFAARKTKLKREVFNHEVAFVLAMKSQHSSLQAMVQPKRWFKLPAYMNNSKAVGVLNRCIAGDAGLEKGTLTNLDILINHVLSVCRRE